MVTRVVMSIWKARGMPYEGAREMLLADNVENKDFLRVLPASMYEELPAPKKKS